MSNRLAAMFDSSHWPCGITNNFLAACWAYYMAWGGVWLEDQALFAYGVLVPLGGEGGEAAHAEAIWSRMVLGYTALWTQADILAKVELRQLVLLVMDHGADEYRLMKEGDLKLYDSRSEHGACRIKTVYTGTNVVPVGWFRPI